VLEGSVVMQLKGGQGNTDTRTNLL